VNKGEKVKKVVRFDFKAGTKHKLKAIEKFPKNKQDILKR